jgi:hypothetical protein
MRSKLGFRVTAWIVAGMPVLATSACATLTAEQRAAAAKVQVITSEPALECQNLGVVSGSREGDGPGGVRAKAVLLGANTVRMDKQGVTTAFYCPDAAETASDTDPVP